MLIFFFAFLEEAKQFNDVLKLKFIFPDFNPAFYYMRFSRFLVTKTVTAQNSHKFHQLQ